MAHSLIDIKNRLDVLDRTALKNQANVQNHIAGRTTDNTDKLAGQWPSYYRCTSGCSWTCSSCSGSCSKSCSGCTGTCQGSCSSGCQGSCTRACQAGCGSSCSAGCTSSCSSRCTSVCTQGCQGCSTCSGSGR